MNEELQTGVLQPGDRFRGYVVDRLIGNGGIGAVYLVKHEVLDTLYALKVLYPDVADAGGDFVNRFVREAKLASRIKHPNLVAVHDAGYDEARGLYYLVMDYVVGGTVRQTVAINGRIEVRRAVDVVAQVASALAAAQLFHVVHRDIKPENIMITPDGVAKLVDLGVAKADNVHDSFRTAAKTVFGTPAYVAPEQALDASTVDSRADIYSLGVVLFEMVCGQRPYKGECAADILAQVLNDAPLPDVRTFNPAVPEPVARLIARMCSKKPNGRPASPQALLDEIAAIGYGGAAAAPEFELTPEARETGFPIDLDKPMPEAESTAFITTDAEINRFLRRRNARRARRKVVRYIVELAVLAAAAVALALLAR